MDLGRPTRGRKDNSCDVISSFKGQIAKLELGMAGTKEDVNLLEQRIKGMQGSSVHMVSRKEFMAFQDKVLSVSRVDALTRHMEAWEAWDKQMRHELAICKVIVSTRVMATHEGLEDNHTTRGKKRCPPILSGMGRVRCPTLRRIRARTSSRSLH